MKTIGILLLDSFRMLRSQKLFWLVLGISGFVALAYVSIGFDDTGYSVFFGLWRFENELLRGGEEMARVFYLLLFTNWIVPMWLSFVAIVLALISCGPIVPEFVREGSIDFFLSKPPRRSVMFLGKFLGSLLFVFLQIALFSLIVFLGFGFRFGEWNFTIFWAIPVLVLVFALVYVVHVFVAVWSGSTVFGLLAAFVVWALAAMGEWGERIVYEFAYLTPRMGKQLDFASPGGWVDVEPREDAGPGWVSVYKAVNALRTPLPKTRGMTLQLKTLIKVNGSSGGGGLAGKDTLSLMFELPSRPHEREAMRRFETRHPLWLDAVTSVAFAGFFLFLATVIFCRKDY